MAAPATIRPLPLLLAIAFAGCEDGEPLPPAQAPNASAAANDPAASALPPPVAASAPTAGIEAKRTDLELDESDSASAQGVPHTPRVGAILNAQGGGASQAAQEEKWMEVETGDVAFAGKKLRALRSGPPQGRAVLLLHGGRFSSATWLELGTLKILARNGYRVVAIDLPGFGKSKDVVAKPAEFLHAALPILDLKRPVVVFPSMSGSFAFPEAVSHPNELAGLVPIAPVEIETWAPKLKGSTLPTLLFWGENDKVIPIAQADLLEASIPKLRKVVLSGAEHACYQDRPEEFHRKLIEFLKSLDASK